MIPAKIAKLIAILTKLNKNASKLSIKPTNAIAITI